MQFIIEKDNPEIGFYLYVFKDGCCIVDYLQNTFEDCVEVAYEEFDVPKEKWTTKPTEI